MHIRVWIRIVYLAFSNFFSNKKQNILSISALILGSLSIAAVFTINENVNVYVESLIAKSGGPNIFVYTKVEDISFANRDIQQLKALTTSRYTVLDLQLPTSAIFNSKMSDLQVFSYYQDYEKARPVSVLRGQFLSIIDAYSPSNNIVLSPAVINKLSIIDPIGKKIVINYKDRNLVANIIGIAKSEFLFEDRGVAWVGRSLFRELAQVDTYSSLILGTTTYAGLDSFEEEVRSLLSPKFKNNIDIYNPKNEFEKMRGEYQTFINTGGFIGLLSLFGGCVGVMNLMIMNVRLRVKEIGLYRALGFSTQIVLLIFLLESMMTLNLGGLIGAIVGCVLGYFIASQVVTTPPFFCINAFLFSFFVSSVIGLFFSFLPARNAARMDPVEALKS